MLQSFLVTSRFLFYLVPLLYKGQDRNKSETASRLIERKRRREGRGVRQRRTVAYKLLVIIVTNYVILYITYLRHHVQSRFYQTLTKSVYNLN